MIEDPSEFFARNGGSALLAANGSIKEPDLAALLGACWPTWPKEGELSTGRTTRPGTPSVPATIAVWSGGLAIRSPACLQPVDGVSIAGGIKGDMITEFAWSLIHLPRPLLFIVAGPAYNEAIGAAKFTLDPFLVECHGQISFTLDAEYVMQIGDFATHFGLAPSKLRQLRLSLEAAIADDNIVKHPSHRIIVQQARRALGMGKKRNDRDIETEIKFLADYWRDIAVLPPTSNPAWHIAEKINREARAAI